MAIQTRLQVVQEIRQEVYSGVPPNDASISEQFILRKVNNWIAEMAVKSAYSTTNLEGITYADDIFNVQYNNLTLLDDALYGGKKVALPALPIGLPRQRSFNVFASGANPTLFKPISRFEYQRMKGLPSLKKIFYFIENGTAYFDFSFVDKILSISAINIVITTSGALDLAQPLNLPDDMIETMKAAVIGELRIMIGVMQPATK